MLVWFHDSSDSYIIFSLKCKDFSLFLMLFGITEQ